MQKISVFVLALALGLGFVQTGVASEDSAKPADCKQAAKEAGITDKKEAEQFIKKCEQKHKEAAGK